MSVRDDKPPVVVLDLRGGPASAPDWPAEAAAARRWTAAEGPGPRLLILDSAAELTRHVEAFERVMSRPAAGGRVQLLCLAIGGTDEDGDTAVGAATTAGGAGRDGAPIGADRLGSEADAGAGSAGTWAGPGAPPPATDTAPAFSQAAGSLFLLPSVLRAADAGILWVADPAGGGDPPPPAADREPAIGALVELLRTPELYDSLLDALQHCPSAVAALSARVVEHDLSPRARDQAWQEALFRFVGDTGTDPSAGSVPVSPGDLPRALAELLDPGLARAPDHLLRADGPAVRARTACERALDAAEIQCGELGLPLGLLTGRRETESLPKALDAAARGLWDYRRVAEGALRDSAVPGLTPAEAGQRLAHAGIEAPRSVAAVPYGGDRGAPAAGDPVEEGLGRFVLRLLGGGLALRAITGRLTWLSEEMTPAVGVDLLAEFDGRSAVDVPNRLSLRHSFRLAPVRPAPLLCVALVLALACLGDGPRILLALLPAALLAAGCARAAAARPNRSARGSVELAPPAQSAAALLGAAAGYAIGHTVRPPSWAALAALALSVVLGALLTVVRWTRAVDDWWLRTRVGELRGGLADVDAALAEAVRRHWWAIDDRVRCADAARVLAGAFRGVPADPHTAGSPSPSPPASDSWDTDVPPSAPSPPSPGSTGADDWLSAEDWSDEPEANTAPWSDPTWPARADGPVPRPLSAGNLEQPGNDVPRAASWTVAAEGAGTGVAEAGAGAAARLTPLPPGADTSRSAAADGDAARRSRSARTASPTPPLPPVVSVPGVLPVLAAAGTPPGDAAERGPAGLTGTAPGNEPPAPDTVTPAWLEREAADGGPELMATLLGDLADATADELRQLWAARPAGGGSAKAEAVSAAVRRGIARAHRHLVLDGIVSSPSYARSERRRPDSSALLGTGIRGIGDLLSTDAVDGQLVPLTSPVHTPLLSRDPSTAQLIPFAPVAIRDVGGRIDTSAVIWTALGRFSGALELVCLRPGAVRVVRARAWAQDDGTQARAATTASDGGAVRHPRHDSTGGKKPW
ncbi:hypothetical protein [Streptomyces sp. SPB162]|uniref:hypothetical protein n=1 Tax=Streptomyces sp. SPB162 TaxID=2940560 RepID=UPI002404E740|nr:hypothetical protein [Streptomyces sp. SPB162]MDF9817077.1 hypothetical protein [Streptomyces sp. SPB162]